MDKYWVVFDGEATVSFTGIVKRISREGTVIDEHDLAELGERTVSIEDGEIIGDGWIKPGIRFSMDMDFPDLIPNKQKPE